MQISGPIELIKKSIQLFFEKNNLVYLLKIYTPLLPFVVISIIQNYITKYNYPVDPWVSGLFLFAGTVSLIISIFVGLAGVYAVGNVVSGRYLSVRETYQSAWKKLWKFSLLEALTFIIILGGLILLIIPGLVFGTWYSFSRFMFVEKNLGIKESLSKSKALISGRFWKVFGRLFVFGLFAVLIQIVAGLLPFGTGSIITTLAGSLFILLPYLLFRELDAVQGT